MTPLRVLTWHVHGSYLDSLSRTGHELFLPVSDPPRPGYAGRFPELPDTVVEVPEAEVRDLDVDVVLFQSRDNWERDQHELLSDAQRSGPRIYVEHDPPREHPTDTRHWVRDPEVLIVQVTAFNALMWDTGPNEVRVIDHGVPDPGVAWTGELERGIVVVNDLDRRGRRLGADLFLDARESLPLDLVGMGAERLGGLGEVRRSDLPSFEARYRLFFNPIRYTSLGLSMIEAMLVGLPIVAFATTEIPTVIEDGVSGFIATDPAVLRDAMTALLADRELARQIGEAGRRTALERFAMDRFARDWTAAFELAAGRRAGTRPRSRPAPLATTTARSAP
jgi:glycosyltransferase involved in cell wall biosynthesis